MQNISNKGLACRIYEELSKLDNIKTNNPVKKWTKDLNTLPMHIQMPNKHR